MGLDDVGGYQWGNVTKRKESLVFLGQKSSSINPSGTVSLGTKSPSPHQASTVGPNQKLKHSKGCKRQARNNTVEALQNLQNNKRGGDELYEGEDAILCKNTRCDDEELEGSYTVISEAKIANLAKSHKILSWKC